MGRRLSKKKRTTGRARGSSTRREASTSTPSAVDSSPAFAAARSLSSGMVPQNRYDSRVAISSPVGRRSSGWAGSGAPHSSRYRKSGDCSTTSMTAAMPEANPEAPRTDLARATSSSVSAWVTDRR
jgi:hypothetical protein